MYGGYKRVQTIALIQRKSAEKGIDRFWVKWSEMISRIRFKSEQLLAALCPFPSRRMVLSRAERACHDTGVAQPVKHGLAVNELNTLNDVGMMPENGVCSRSNRRVGKRALIGGELRWRVHLSLIHI